MARIDDETKVATRDSSRLRHQAFGAVAAAGVLHVAASAFAAHEAALRFGGAFLSFLIYATVGFIVMTRITAHHPFRSFGWPNVVTLGRTVIAALIAGYAAEVSLWTLAPSERLAWAVAAMSALALILDFVDGWLARRIGPRSDFGARFDMESDAMLLMILSVLALVLGKVGLWVLLVGLLRYVFVAASYAWTWLDRPLPASTRRKVVCVIQGVCLTLVVTPAVQGTTASAIAAVALVSLVWSFGLDFFWLWTRRHLRSAFQAGQ